MFVVTLVDVSGDSDDSVECVVNLVGFSEPILDEGG